MGFLAPTLLAALGVVASVFYPRAPTWQVASMKYKSVSLNLDFTTNARIEMGLEVFNANYMPVTMIGMSMMMQHDDMHGDIATFGVVSVLGEGPYTLPARGSKIIESELKVEELPMGMGAQMAAELKRNNGTLITRALAIMDIKVLVTSVVVEAECVQHIQADVFPMVITKVACDYYYKQIRVPMLPP